MDKALLSVQGWLTKNFSSQKYLTLVRQAMDEVIDNPRTGRKTIAELEKTEKTYIGTKVEIMLRNALGLKKGAKMDLMIEGEEVDVKFTLGNKWMIPQEAFGHLCLVVRGDETKGVYEAGLLRMTHNNLTKAENRDRKLCVSASGRKNIVWLAQGKLPVRA